MTHQGKEGVHEASIAKFEEEHAEDDCFAEAKVRTATCFEASPEANKHDTPNDLEAICDELNHAIRD